MSLVNAPGIRTYHFLLTGISNVDELKESSALGRKAKYLLMSAQESIIP